MKEVSLFKVSKHKVFTEDYGSFVFRATSTPHQNMGITTIMRSRDDLIYPEECRVSECETHRIRQLFDGSISEKLIAFDFDFKEMILPEIMEKEIKQEYDSAILYHEKAKKEVARLTDEKSLLCKRIRELEGSFFERLKFVFLGKFGGT